MNQKQTLCMEVIFLFLFLTDMAFKKILPKLQRKLKDSFWDVHSQTCLYSFDRLLFLAIPELNHKKVEKGQFKC